MPEGDNHVPLPDELVIGGIYVLLFVRGHPPQPNNFHWALHLHTEAFSGMKYHIKTMGEGWIADHGPVTGVSRTFLLVGLFHIATVRPDTMVFDRVDEIMRTYDTALNTTGITCRVWVLWIFELLKRDEFLHCDNLKALEVEIFGFGNRNVADAANGVQPYPVTVSRICRGL